MAVIRLEEGTSPPFGAQVMNARQQAVGLVADGGGVYLSGMRQERHLSVSGMADNSVRLRCRH